MLEGKGGLTLIKPFEIHSGWVAGRKTHELANQLRLGPDKMGALKEKNTC